jgi:NADPH-dependent curcumin reductase CurA
MSSLVNRQWRLTSRPAGMVQVSNFGYFEEPVAELKSGEILLRVLYVSFDPAMRAFLREGPSYVAPQQVGAVMRAGAIGQVAKSARPDYRVGEIVFGALGWQEYATIDEANLAGVARLTPAFPLPRYMGVLGGTGLTAYFGMLDVGKIKEGETVLTSGAAGATGSVASQIAKIHGCRSIGIAGGPMKCRWLIDELGLDGAIDYKNDNVSERLAQLAPKGVDVYFENVGGPLLETVIGHMALRGRIVLCGMIATYNAEQRPPGPSNLFDLIARRIRMEGFLAGDYLPRFAEGRTALEGWLSAGRLKSHEDVQTGFENIPKTFMRLFTGENLGKQMLKIADPAPFPV